jgi:hypothetical protein
MAHTAKYSCVGFDLLLFEIARVSSLTRQNAYAERMISRSRERIDNIVVFGERPTSLAALIYELQWHAQLICH